MPLMNPSKFAMAAFTALLVTACGGGGGGGGGNTPAAISVRGMAATGAPLAGGTVQIYGADALPLLATPVAVAANGSYQATIPAGAKFPLIFVADDGSQKLISVMASASDAAIVNVTQLTNLLASRISSTGDPANLLSEVASGNTFDSAKVQNKTTELLASIKPLLDAIGLNSADSPISKEFVANGSGYDKMLDVLDVKIEPKAGTSTIELTVKQSVAESGTLPKVTLSSTEALPTLPTISSGNMPPDGLSLALDELLSQATACYALSKADRINANGIAATDIKADACKAIFLGNNPQSYKSGGHIVKSTDHFGGIFTATVPVTFTSPRYYYTVSEDVAGGPKAGDVVFGYRWKDGFGNFQYDRNVVRRDTDGKYRFIGNQYAYPGGTSAYGQRRNFLMQSESTYTSVGYVFDVPCISGANGNTSWKKVVITSPNDKQITLMPNKTGTSCNFSYFTVALDGITPSTTGFIRIRSQYEDATKAASAHPRTSDAGLAFAQTDLLESEIEQIPQFGRWKYEYFFDANSVTTNTPNATQFFRTIARSMTIAGFRQSVKLPGLEASYASQLIASATPSCVAAGCAVVPQNPFQVSWMPNAEASALSQPPATWRVRIYGKYGPASNRQGFEDTNDVRSTVRSTNISCGNGDPQQPQCDTNNGALVFAIPGGSRQYDRYTAIGNIDLVSRLPDGSDASHFFTLSKLVQP